MAATPAIAPVSSSPWWRHEWVQGGALIIALVVAYLPVWRAGFVWDDDLHLTANPHVQAADGLKQIWSSGAANYFPLTMTSFWALHAIWALNPLPYHLASLALHMGSAILLWRVLRRLGVGWAWLGAALWALHPVQVESVAWISELKNTQSCVFYLAAVWAFLRWLETGGPERKAGAGKFYALTALFAVSAILSKSSTVMLPVVLGLCWWWQRRAWNWRDLKWLAPFFAISLAASGWTIWEQKYNSMAMGSEWDLTVPQRFVVAGRAVWFYLGKLVWPQPLIFIYPRWDVAVGPGWGWLLGFAALGALGMMWRARDRGGRAWFFATAYFMVSLFPVLGFFDIYFFRFSYVGDHFQYLASMGALAGLAAWAATLVSRKIVQGKVVFAGAGLVLVVLAGLSWRQAGTFHDGYALYRSTLALNPACWLARNNLGLLLINDGKRAEALAEYRRAVQDKPNYAEAHFNLGTAAMEDGRPADAVEHFTIAAREAPRDGAAPNSLGVALLQLGRFPEATEQFEKAVRLSPKLAAAHYNLGNARFNQQRYEQARAAYTTSIRWDKTRPMVHNNLGMTYLQTGRDAEAAKYFESALQLDPHYAQAHYNLALARSTLGDMPEAIRHYRAALQEKPDYPEAHHNLGLVFLRMGQSAEGEQNLAEALRLRPNFPEAAFSYAEVARGAGRNAEAIRRYEAVLALRPNYPEALTALGLLLLSEKRPAEAVAPLEAGVRLQPKVAANWFNVGNALLHSGRAEEALACYDRALQLRADYIEAGFNSGVALRALGRNAEAAQRFEAVLVLKPDVAEAREALAQLRAGGATAAPKP